MREKLRNTRLVSSIIALAKQCDGDQKALMDLLQCIGDADSHIANRAAWTTSHLFDLSPKMFESKHHALLLSMLSNSVTGGIKRCIMQIWQTADLPDDLVPGIAEHALAYLENPKEDIAVRAFAISTLGNCMKTIPELKEEVLFLLEKEMPTASVAIHVRIKRLMATVNV